MMHVFLCRLPPRNRYIYICLCWMQHMQIDDVAWDKKNGIVQKLRREKCMHFVSSLILNINYWPCSKHTDVKNARTYLKHPHSYWHVFQRYSSFEFGCATDRSFCECKWRNVCKRNFPESWKSIYNTAIKRRIDENNMWNSRLNARDGKCALYLS